MRKLLDIPMDAIDPNPFRRLAKYPYVERKVEALKSSIEAVGLWEGVTARKKGNRYELAFGHHRIEAARRVGLKSAPMIVRNLTDKQMLQFMGRGNDKVYNVDFPTLLGAWNAVAAVIGKRAQAIEIAMVLGWTQAHKSGATANHTAEACHAAAVLIGGGHIRREDLTDLSVTQARKICSRAVAKIKQLEKLAKIAKRPVSETEAAKKHIGKAVAKTAAESRRGQIMDRDLPGQVDVNAYHIAKEAKKRSPLFEQFGRDLANRIAKTLNNDGNAGKLADMQAALGDITTEADRAAVRAVRRELGKLEARVAEWKKALEPNKVVKLPVVGRAKK